MTGYEAGAGASVGPALGEPLGDGLGDALGDELGPDELDAPGDADGWSCGRGGRTTSGSMRAIWIGGTRNFLITVLSIPNVAVSSGLNSP